MTNTYDTSSEPLGSTAVKVLYNNASNLDDAVNSTDSHYWIDRPPFLRQRKTFWGMEQEFNQFLASTAYENPPLIYVDGSPLTVDRSTQVIARGGNLYSIKLPSSFPVNLSGNWATDEALLVVRGDSSLRQDLITQGATIVKGASQTVNNIAALRALLKTSVSQYATTLGYYAPGDGGGTTYWIDQADTTSDDNGGSVIVAADGARWKIFQHDLMNLRQWGCKGDGVTDDTAGYVACVLAGQSFYITDGEYPVAPIDPAGAQPPYPGTPLPGEPDRTSSAVLTDGQCVIGSGPNAILRWNNAQKQCFFKVQVGKNCDISNVRFIGGYSAMVQDPTSNFSVEHCGLTNCYLEAQLIGLISGRQPVLDPGGSRTVVAGYMRGCKLSSQTVHGAIFTNSQRAAVLDCDFHNIVNGMCVDFSQGSYGSVMADCRGDVVQYVSKIESSSIPGVTPEQSASQRTVYSNLSFSNISKWAILANSAADRLVIDGCVFHGNSATATDALLWFDAVSLWGNSGQAVVSNCVLTMENGGCIQNGLNSGTLPLIVDGCQLSGGGFGINMQAQRIKVSDSTIVVNTSTGDCVKNGSGNFSNLVRATFQNVKFVGNRGIAEVGNTGWQHVKVSDCEFEVSSQAIDASAATGGVSWFKFCDNTVNRTAVSALAAVSLNTANSIMVNDNQFNLNIASSPVAVSTTGSTSKSSFKNNISTVGFSIGTPDTETNANTTGNILNAVHAI